MLYWGILFFSFIIGCVSQYKAAYSSLVISKYKLCNARSIHYFPVVIFLFFLFILSAFRSVGTDYESYVSYFVNASKLNGDDVNIELGYFYLNKFVRYFSDNPISIFVITTFINISLFIIPILKKADKLLLCLSLLAYVSLYYFPAYNILRIYIAAGFTFYSIDYLLNRKYILYILVIVVAVFFHKSALIMLFPLICYWIYIHKVVLFYLFLFLALFGMYYMIDFFPLLGLNDRYVGYVKEINKDSFAGLGVLLFHAPVLALVYYARYKYPNDNTVKLSLVLAWTSLIVMILGYWAQTLSRLYVYFAYPHLISVPFIIKKIDTICVKAIFILIFVCYYIFRFYAYCSDSIFSDEILPYKSLLF